MTAPLTGLRIVEVSAFVAAPLGGMTLAQLGAEVIRIDPLGGNIDHNRWPLAPSGASLYWASLNKGKQSVTLALKRPEGQELARALMCAPGPHAGIVLTNLPARGWMSYEMLKQHRADLIMARLTGNFDGSSAVDYTVNCASGFPAATGFDEHPINHVLPAWDVTAGLYLALGIVTAERDRQSSGRGQETVLALSDVMLATVGNLGYIADVLVNDTVREPIGNQLYGAYGGHFSTADHREVMVVAISNRQWKALGQATGLMDRLAMIGPLLEVDLATEGGRYQAGPTISAVLAPWFAARTLAKIRETFEDSGVLWGPYQDFRQLVEEDSRCSLDNPLFGQIEQAGAGRILAPRSPLSFSEATVPPPLPAPVLGQDTENVLRTVLGVSSNEISSLRRHGILAAHPEAEQATSGEN